VLRYLQILRTYRHAGIKYLHCKFCARNTYCCICHYPPVFWSRYLHIPTALCAGFDQDTYTYLLLYAPVSALVSARLRRRLCGRIAVASPHRIGAASSRYRRLATSLELQLPVVPPTRCTRTEEVEPQQRALVDAMMMTQVEVVVERL
jgi:hypothetical protein